MSKTATDKENVPAPDHPELNRAPNQPTSRLLMRFMAAIGVLVVVCVSLLVWELGTSWLENRVDLSHDLGDLWWVAGAVVGAIIAVGLFRYKNWARWIVIVVGGLGSLGGLAFILGNVEFLNHYWGSVLLIIGLSISGVMIGVVAWFASHGKDFH